MDPVLVVILVIILLFIIISFIPTFDKKKYIDNFKTKINEIKQNELKDYKNQEWNTD